MKKVLLGTSALIAAAAVSAPAMAQEQIQLGLGGKMEQYFGVTSFDDAPGDDRNATGIDTDTEVYFTGATTLDNGLTVGAVIQLEAEIAGGASTADEQYAYIEGAFGRIMAGEKDGVGTQLAHTAPSVGLAKGDVEDWTNQGPNLGDRAFNFVETTWSSDSAQVSYITPSLAGFSAGVTYMPTSSGVSNSGDALLANTESLGESVGGGSSHSNDWQASIAYNGEFSGVGIGADIAYRQAEGDELASVTLAEDVSAWRAGLVLSFAGFQFGGSYLTQEDSTYAVGAEDDGFAWDLGVAYETGPYGVSLTYAASEVETGANTEDEYQQIHLGGTYDLGPGITLAGAAFWAESDADGAEDTDGTGAVVGLQLSF